MLDGWQKLHAVKFFLKFVIANKHVPARLRSFYQEKEYFIRAGTGSIGESNRFGCCGFSYADLRCKFKLHIIEGG